VAIGPVDPGCRDVVVVEPKRWHPEPVVIPCLDSEKTVSRAPPGSS
jgi:hypothetical protein